MWGGEKDKAVLIRFGQNVALLRRKAGLSQLELALDTGISKSHISDIEKGRRNVSLVSLTRLARGLHVDISALLEGCLPL